jgi:release factor glutamine methyltransferase
MTEQELMLTAILNCKRIDLYADPKPLNPSDHLKLQHMQARRFQGEPLQYILGFTEFCGYKIFVDSSVLIPRPETELLVEWVLEELKGHSSRTCRILDLATGSGNIGISLAKEVPFCEVVGVDVSPAALKIAEKNIHYHGLKGRMKCVEEDLALYLERAFHLKIKFDVIISNPPYISSALLKTLPKDVQQEPLIALNGGEDGLDFYRSILRWAKRLLNPNGFIIMEMGDGQSEAIASIARSAGQFNQISFRNDYVGTPRMIMAK